MTRRKIKWAIFGAALLLFLAFALFYTRPQTIEQRYPFLDLTQCTRISGDFDRYYVKLSVPLHGEFSIGPDNARFDELLQLLRETKFRTKLTNLFPTFGARMHEVREGDLQWTVRLQIENAASQNGDAGTWFTLCIDNFFGDLKVSCGTKTKWCTVPNQDAWLKAVLDCITQAP